MDLDRLVASRQRPTCALSEALHQLIHLLRSHRPRAPITIARIHVRWRNSHAVRRRAGNDVLARHV